MILTSRSPIEHRVVAVAAAAVVGAVGIASVELAGDDDGVSICPIRTATGGYCPGCGAARAARHVLHGDVTAAWVDHPWLVLASLQLLVVGVLFAFVGWARAVAPRMLPIVGALNVVLLVGIWIGRLAVGTIPSPF